MTADLNGRVALVTGATDGIGELTAQRLAQADATVRVHGRSDKKVSAVVERIRKDGGQAHGLVSDLASLAGVRALAQELTDATQRLDILINNAGVGDPRGPRRESEDGYELHFAYFDRMDRAEPEAQARDADARQRLMSLIDRLTAER